MSWLLFRYLSFLGGFGNHHGGGGTREEKKQIFNSFVVSHQHRKKLLTRGGPNSSVQECAEEGEECVIESAMFTIEGDTLFISNVGGAPRLSSGYGLGGNAMTAEKVEKEEEEEEEEEEEVEEEEEAGAAPAGGTPLKPEDAAAGGEYVGGENKEAVAEADAAGALFPTVVVDGESLPPLGKTRLDPGALIVLGGAGGHTHIFEVNRTVHAHA